MALAVESEAGPSISVVIPMYNAEKLIERCLAPLLSMLARSEIVQRARAGGRLVYPYGAALFIAHRPAA